MQSNMLTFVCGLFAGMGMKLSSIIIWGIALIVFTWYLAFYIEERRTQRFANLNKEILFHSRIGSKVFTDKRLCAILRIVALSSLLLFLGNWKLAMDSLRTGKWPWEYSIDALYLIEIIGTYAFSSFGVRKALKNGHPWYIALFNGLAFATFGGGVIRDWILLDKTPWFIDEMKTVVTITLYSIVFIIAYKLLSKNKEFIKKWGTHLSILLTATDAIGILAFSIIGVEHAFNAGSIMAIIFLCGFSTQCGGGIISAAARNEIKQTLPKNVPYYLFASFVSILYITLSKIGMNKESAMMLLLVPSIIIGLMVDNDFRDIVTTHMIIPLLSPKVITVCQSVQIAVVHQKEQIACFNKFYRLQEKFYWSKLRALLKRSYRFTLHIRVFHRRLGRLA